MVWLKRIQNNCQKICLEKRITTDILRISKHNSCTCFEVKPFLKSMVEEARNVYWFNVASAMVNLSYKLQKKIIAIVTTSATYQLRKLRN